MFLPEPFTLISFLGLGFVLGLKHAFDADHIVAVSSFVSETKSIKKSALIGVLWGAGHTTVLLLAGILILIFRMPLPKELALLFEFFVGAMLVALGLRAIVKAFKNKVHLHSHSHGKIIHRHIHSHKNSSHHTHTHTPFFVGMVHGLAGSAGLMLLVLAAAKSVFDGLIFILVFGFGSILGMLFASGFLAIPFLISRGFNRFSLAIKFFAGVLSIFLGVAIMFEMAFLGGFFG